MGNKGGSCNRRGKSGSDLILKIPSGTLVKAVETEEILHDFTRDKQRWLICRGGRGGRGNTYFKSPTNRAPNFSTPGELGQSCQIELEL